MGVESVCAEERAVKGSDRGKAPTLWPTSYNRTNCCSPRRTALHSLQSMQGIPLAFAQREMEQMSRKIPSRDIVEKQRALLTKGL